MIFVTGGTGLVGSHLILELLKNNEPVLALKRKSSDLSMLKRIFGYYTSNADYYFDLIHWVEGDLMDPEFVYETIDKVDRVYHTAAFVSFNSNYKKQVLDFNIQSTANIVNACLEFKSKKLCYVSSIAALGEPNDDRHVDENNMWKTEKNKSVYSISKFRAEMEVWRGIAEGLQAAVVNPGIIIGPGNWNTSSPRLFNTIWKSMKYYTNGITGYVSVHDVVKAMVTLMDKGITGERYILCEGNYSYYEIFEKIARSMGKTPPTKEATPILTLMAYQGSRLFSMLTGAEPVLTRETIRAGKNKVFFDNSKIKETLDFSFTSIDKAIEETGKIFLNEMK